VIKLKKLTKEDKLFFFERSWVTLDGLWFLEIENETDWNTALKIDKTVWIRLLKTIFRRMQRYLKMDTLSPANIIKILTLRWSIEGWDYKILKCEENEVDIGIITCPYKESMNRNPERIDKISLICKNMCLPFYKEVIEDSNPKISFEITKSQGLGDNHCNFKFTFQDHISQKEEELIKKEVSLEDRLFYFENHWFTMDGLWMVETENELGKKLALKIDIIVWQRLYQTIFRRLIRYLNIEGNSIKELIKILEFAWNCEGYNYEIVKEGQTDVILNINTCPYKSMMDRNPERHDRIETICKDMCIPFYGPAIKEFNPNIFLERKQFLGVGDSICDYHFTLK
jgi:hypothetical protein